jgi:Ca2+-binding RTX toxin-like protein
LFYSGGPGSGGIDASLSKGPNDIWAGGFGGNNSLIGGAGNDLLTAGSGSDTLTGGGGENGFYFWAVNGGPNSHNIITDFSFIDYVTLGNYGPNAPAEAIASATVANGSTTITLSDKTTITFVGVTNPSSLNGHIFST